MHFIHIRFIECASDCHMVIFYKAAKRLPLSSMSDCISCVDVTSD